MLNTMISGNKPHFSKTYLSGKNRSKTVFSIVRLTVSMAIGLTIAVAVSSFSTFARDCEGIRESVLRLHILANSDSDTDQALKLAVRDRILQLDAELFGNASNLSEAEDAARQALSEIEETAAAEIARQGYDYPVHAEVQNMYFNTREYDTFTLPAGYYDAVRVTIGEGKGRNWWCVLYPPLCLPAAESKTELSDVLTPDQAELVNGKYEFKFAAVELYESFKKSLRGDS